MFISTIMRLRNLNFASLSSAASTASTRFSMRSTQCCLRQQCPSLRPQVHAYSTQKEPSAHREFWKTFGRPIAKVFLMSFLTYQMAYLGWSHLYFAVIQEDAKGVCVQDRKPESRGRNIASKEKQHGIVRSRT